MTQLTAAKKTRTESTFQTLWKRAEQYRQKNAAFRNELDALVQRVQTTVQPIEREAAEADKTLLYNLLKLGQRKSLTQWQRVELSQWIHELTEEMQHYSLIDPHLLDAIASYDAFAIGITLDDDADAPPAEQLSEWLQREREEQEATNQAMQDDLAAEKKAAQQDAEHLVEQMLDQELGPEPEPPANSANYSGDFWQEELNQEWEQLRTQYRSDRAALREELLKELLSSIERQFGDQENHFDDEFFDFFSIDEDDEAEAHHPESESIPAEKPHLTNQVFQRLFRATASRLHPDREPDQATRQTKQGLMSELLRARKEGDVMTMLALYQKYVGEELAFSKIDEKQLIGILEQQLGELKNEQDKIAQQSPLHWMVFERFYAKNSKHTDKAINAHIAQVREDKKVIERMARDIRSLKALKPYLEQRYDARYALPAFIQ